MEIEEDVVEDVIDENIIEEEDIENTDDSEESSSVAIQDEEEEEDRIVSIGETPPEEEPEEEEEPDKSALVKKLRKVSRNLEKKNKALQRQIEANKKATEKVKPVELGEKPTLKSCGYDDVKFEQEIVAYAARKKQVEAQASEKAKEIENQNKSWQEHQAQYVNLQKEHNFKDFTEVEETVSAALSNTQQGIIVQGTADSALLVYALGKNPKKLEELAKIKDPVAFAVKIGNLESQLKVTKKKAPSPEKRVTASKAGGLSGNGDKQLEKLRADAAKTNDYTKVTAYKREHRKG